MEVSIDLADAIQAELNALGHNASASPLPEDFAERLPFTRVETLPGGTRSQVVVDTRTVSLETWGKTMDDAMAESSAVTAELTEMVGGLIGGVQCYRVELFGLPAEDDDPYHPTIPMASATARVTTRTRHI